MEIDLGGNTLVNGYLRASSAATNADLLHPSDIGVTVQGWSSLLDSIVLAGESGNLLYPDGLTLLASNASSPQVRETPLRGG